MRIFLLDDEAPARKTVIAYLKKSQLQDLKIEEASNVSEGLEVLKNFSPDLAILDVNLGSETSFDLLAQLEQINFQIIFISAYDKYAVRAFKFNALDYILKPINPAEFSVAIQKVQMQKELFITEKQLKNLQDDIHSKENNRITLRDSQAIHFVNIKDIIQCKSENNYTVFTFVGRSELVISKTLGEFEELLADKGFFRVHRSRLINMHQIKKYDKREGGFIEMNNNETAPLSRSKKEIFMKLIERL